VSALDPLEPGPKARPELGKGRGVVVHAAIASSVMPRPPVVPLLGYLVRWIAVRVRGALVLSSAG
jgi:hypothetical protein